MEGYGIKRHRCLGGLGYELNRTRLVGHVSIDNIDGIKQSGHVL